MGSSKAAKTSAVGKKRTTTSSSGVTCSTMCLTAMNVLPQKSATRMSRLVQRATWLDD